MAGLLPAIHVFSVRKSWMPGFKPGHDVEGVGACQLRIGAILDSIFK
jgi:hypothetical protein